MVRWGRLHKAAAVRGETGHRFPAGDGRTGLALREPNSETEFGRGVWSPRPSGVHVGTGLRPRPLSPGGDGGCRRIRRGRPMCRPEYVLLREPFTGGYTGPPLRGVEGIPNHPGQRRTAERLRRGCEERVGIGAEIIPKGAINAGQSLSHGCAVPAPFTQGSLALRGTGDADCRVGPAGLLAMTMVFCHSEERSDVGIRPFYSMDGVRAAEVVGPYGRSTGVPAVGRCRHRPLRVVAGSPPRLPGQRLAKRKARKEQLVKFGLCPMISECSTAYNVRKFQQGPARVLVGAALIGQDGLGPRPVVQENAERPGCTTRTRFFF